MLRVARQPLTIHDDGRGGVDADGNGLAGMRTRVRELGGILSIESPRGGGSRLLVRVPIEDSGPDDDRHGVNALERLPPLGSAGLTT